MTTDLPVPGEVRDALAEVVTERSIESWWKGWQENHQALTVNDGIRAARALAHYLNEGIGFYV